MQRGTDDIPGNISADLPADIFQSTDQAFDKIVELASFGKWEVIRPDELKISSQKRNIVLRKIGE